MLKFFRKYNKWILAVGACVLMVTFLVDPSMWARGGDDSGEPIGTIDGQTLTVGQQRRARDELTLLERIGLPTVGRDDAELTWLLMKTEAQSMGLEASQFEVDVVLGLLGLDDAQMAQLARGVGVTAGYVREAIRSWVVMQQYRELVLGLGHMNMQERLSMYMTAQSLYQQAWQAPEFIQGFYLQQAGVAAEAAAGRPRVSEPLLQRMAMDQLATVKFTALTIPAGKALPSVAEPAADKLADLFERYKDKLPARGEEATGLPFGYRTPDRVKLEYLSIPLERLRSKVTIDEADAMEHYEANKDRYRTPPKPGEGDLLSRQGELQPYAVVRSRVMEELIDEKASELADRMVKAARAMLLEQARGLVEKDGYRDVPADWAPLPLSSVAEAMQKDAQFGVLMDAHQFGDRWFDGRDLTQQPGIGRSSTGGARPIPFAAYVLSTREINPDSPLASSTRLQVGMPSAPLTGIDGTRYLFRLTAAQKTRAPDSLDEVRDQVVSDARRLAALQELQAHAQEWIDKALASDDWKAMADAQELSLVESGDVPRREFAGRGQPLPPMVDRVGRSATVIDAVFEKAYALAERGVVADAPLADRIGAAGSEPTLSLVVFRIEGFTPIPRSRYEREASSPLFSVLVNEALKPTLGEDQDVDATDPLSPTALKKRLKFVATGEKAPAN